MPTLNYQVAGFKFSLRLPAGCDPQRLLPSFRAFACREEVAAFEVLFRMEVLPVGRQTETGGGPDEQLLEEETTATQHHALYLTPTGSYRVEVRTRSRWLHVLEAVPPFEVVTARLAWEDPCVGEVLASMVRFVFSQAVLPYGGISLHASVVSLGGRGYLFMGRSGTGKSTHASLWMECFPGCHLLNDDNPTVRLTADGEVRVYGTPWSGKTPCYRNEDYPVGGFVRLVQAADNRFLPCRETDAFMALLPGCALFPAARRLHDALCDTLSRLALTVPTAILECRPDRDAARLCAASLGLLVDEETNRPLS